MRWEHALMKAIDRQAWLEGMGKGVQEAVSSLFASGGKAGIKIRDFLHGTWLGHPLHPVLTDVPVGAWTATVTLDALEMATGREGFGKGADASLLLGLAGATTAAVTGLTDYQHVSNHPRRLGMLHAMLNIAATVLYVASWVARKRRNRPLGWGLGLLGYTTMGASAYLGGHLVYMEKIGVDHAPKLGLPMEFTPVMPQADLAEGQPVRVEVDTVPLVLVRRGERIFCLADRCAHLGGPLSGGEVTEDNVIVCPWHGSRFYLQDGRLAGGPSTYVQPCFETRVRDGQIEVRAGRDGFV